MNDAFELTTRILNLFFGTISSNVAIIEVGQRVLRRTLICYQVPGINDVFGNFFFISRT